MQFETEKEVAEHAQACVEGYSAAELLANGHIHVDMLEGRVEFTDYMGSCLSLAPSGKYYMPWACSNLDPCEFCDGEGKEDDEAPCEHCGGVGSQEAHFDEIFYEELESAAERAGVYITGSEGDGCDVMVGTCLEYDCSNDDDPNDVVEELISQDPDCLEDRREELFVEIEDAISSHRRWNKTK